MRSVTLDEFVWFKNDNYEGLGKFEMIDWASILHQRLVINAVLKAGDFKMVMVPFYEDIVAGNISIPAKRDLGLAKRNETHTHFLSETDDHVAFWDRTHVIQHVQPFSMASARIAYKIVKDLNIEKHQAPERSEAFGLDVPYHEEVYPLDFLISQKVTPCAAVQLNLSAPDDVIIAELKRFLPKYRQALDLNSDAKVTDLDVSKLRNYRVIEYFDIQIWLRMNNCEVTDSLLSLVLFPERDDHQTFFAQTVKRFIKRVGTYAYTQALFARCSSVHHK